MSVLQFGSSVQWFATKTATGSERSSATKKTSGSTRPSGANKAIGSERSSAARKGKANNGEQASSRRSSSAAARPSAVSSAAGASGRAKAASQPSSKATRADGAATAKKQQAYSRSQTGRNAEFDDFFANSGKQDGTKKAAPKKKASSGKSKAKATKRKKRSKLKLLIQSIFIGACLLLAWCLYTYYVLIFNEQQPLHKADAGIVLGAALWNEQPSPALKERLDYAIELYEQGLFDYFILSGGKPSYSRGLSEAEGMQHYLVDAGIPADKLLLESQSSDTYENLLFSQRVAENHQVSSTIIITHNYHTKRAEDIARHVGLEHVQTAGVETTVLNESYHYTREMLAFTKWQLNKMVMPFGLTL